MAPPEKTFPISELEDRIHLYDVDYKEKSRKLPKGFDLKRDCELYELVQYSCTTQEEIEQRSLLGLKPARGGKGGWECYPFVRLFRRCKYGNQEFNVETTAWEGRHKWKPSNRLLEEQALAQTAKPEFAANGKNEGAFAKYGSYFWSGK